MAIMQYLLDEVGEKRRYLLQKYDGRTHESKLSLDANAVLKPLLDMGIATEFLSSYLSYRTHKKAASDMKKKVDSYFVGLQRKGVNAEMAPQTQTRQTFGQVQPWVFAT